MIFMHMPQLLVGLAYSDRSTPASGQPGAEPKAALVCCLLLFACL